MRSHVASPLLKLNLIWMAALLAAMAALTGCGASRLTPPSVQTGVALHGHVHGGQQPIDGAHVYLFAANTNSYGGYNLADSTSNASSSLLNPADTLTSDSIGAYVLTDAAGDFDITGDYSCTAGSQVYLYVHGGDAGAGPNSAIGLLTILGNCSAGTFASVPFIEINEVSTIAAAYSFAGYASDATHISSNGSPQATTGIANAFATASNLSDLATGSALTVTPAGNGTPPTTTINTLANILAACVNTADIVEDDSHPGSPQPLSAHPHSLPFSSSCVALGNAVSTGGTNQFAWYGFDTADAAIFIAQAPGANVATLYDMPTTQAPFSPALTTQPNDFTLAISFTGGGVSIPTGLAVDATGSVWIANIFGVLAKLSPLGAPISPSGGFTGGGLNLEPLAVAIDLNGNAWVTNDSDNSISEFTNTGLALSPTAGFTGDGLSCPDVAAIDLSGDIWAPNSCASSLSQFNSAGTPATGTGFTGGGLSQPLSVAIDLSGYIWAANSDSSISQLSSTGSPITTSTGFTGGGLNAPYSIAVDSSGNLWTANFGGDTLSEFTNAGAAISPSAGFLGGGLANPTNLSIDGAGNLWAADNNAPAVSEFSNAGVAISPSAGYSGGGSTAVSNPYGIAVDSAGNVWISSNHAFVSEIVGAATPVETPLVQALQDNCIAQRPCTPPVVVLTRY